MRLPRSAGGVDAASLAAAAAAAAPGWRLAARLDATRAPSEPAWHRRARRARAEARVIVRLDAARARLASHHSAPFGGMRRNGGGKGAAGGGNVLAARQLLLSLFDGAVGNRGRQVQRGRGGGGGGEQLGGGSRPREGEWMCRCGFPTNRPYRVACHACGRPRSGAEVGRADGGKGDGRSNAGGGGDQGKGRFPGSSGEGRWGSGPVGAGGSRPILGRGEGERFTNSPSGRTKGGGERPAWGGKGLGKDGNKGKPTATTCEDTDKGKGKGVVRGAEGVDGRGEARWMQEHERRKWVRPARVVDDDAFELVQPRRVCVGRSCEGKGGDATGQRSHEDTSAPTQRRLWSDDISDDDGLVDDEEGGEVEGDDGKEQGEPQADPRQLRAAFQEHARAVRELERRGDFGPALDTLRRARDQAEREWRETKEPAPLPKRLEWAEAKLGKAQAALARARLALDEFDEETDRKRERLCAQIEEAERWHRWRQEQLDGIHAEAGEKAVGRGSGRGSAAGAEVRQHIRGRFLPEVQAILEELQDGTAVHERLTLLAAGLADAEQKLGEDQANGGAQHFDMYDEGEEEQWGENEWDEEDDAMEQEQEERKPSRPTTGEEGGKGGKPAEWKPEGPGRWSRRAADDTGRASATDGGQANDTAATSLGHGRTTAMQADESNSGGRGAGARSKDDDEEAGHEERSAKHRRCRTEADDRAEQDARRALELHRQQTQAAAAQKESYEAGAGGFGSDIALSIAAQHFVQQVQEAQRKAQEKGIDPRKDGKELLQLTPTELREWMESNLEEGRGS